MKYIAVLDTDEIEDFAFFEDGKEKYLHAIDANSINGEWIYLPFKPLEQEPFINILCISSGVCEYDKQKVLDKIRAEMLEEMLSHSGTGEEVIQAYADGLKKGLEFIDKYKGESESKDE